MKVLVSDTSVLIDLARGDFLEDAFRLPYELAVPDVLFEQEIAPYPDLAMTEGLGLRIEEVAGEALLQVVQIRAEHRYLSIADCLALILAETKGWVLLAGDGELRELAQQRKVEFHGVLWLLDELDQHLVSSPTKLRKGLERIHDHPRCRLPAAEVNVRLERWRR